MKNRRQEVIDKKIYIFIGLIVLAIYIFIKYSLTKDGYVMIEENLVKIAQNGKEIKEDLKYILIWTHTYTQPFNIFQMERQSFLQQKCEYNNCFVTKDRKYLKNLTMYDAILFHAPEYTFEKGFAYNTHGYPNVRSPNQRYIFSCIESAANYPVCDQKWDGYFNWTMTYRTDSDIPWKYIYVKDLNGNVIGPKRGIEWIDDRGRCLNTNNVKAFLNREVLSVVKGKSKAAAWFVSNCNAKNRRDLYGKELKEELKKYGMVLDVYGKCGDMVCPTDNSLPAGVAAENINSCSDILKKDYFFYLAFENTNSKDYVSEKFVRALLNYAVPIVLGQPDYSGFGPPGSYINANDYSPADLAKVIHAEITAPSLVEYSSRHCWRDSYTFNYSYSSPETHPFCLLCKALNQDKESRVYDDLRGWWNDDGACNR